MSKYNNCSILAGRIRLHVIMKFNKSATEITEHTEIEKNQLLLCDLCVLCG
jgi:hypothetical protein